VATYWFGANGMCPGGAQIGSPQAPQEADMARITRLELDPITVDVANAIVDVHLDVASSRSDKDANTPDTMVMALENLNEDLIGAANPDDIKAHVVLTPVVAHPTRADSQIRTLTIE
jgi:hypothetical protein